MEMLKLWIMGTLFWPVLSEEGVAISTSFETRLIATKALDME